MTDPEAILLLQKARIEGLTYEEKAKLYLLTTFQSKCKCATFGDKCKCESCKIARHHNASLVNYEP